MASFTSYDFSESMAQAEGFTREDVVYAEAAWGRNGDFCEWDGGFLMRLKDGRFAYIEGWCDTTGWGCQDGVKTELFDAKPDLITLAADEEWIIDPVDLNKLLRGEIKGFDE